MDQGHQLLFVVLQANAIADWKFSSHHMMCDENHERRMEANVRALLETVNKNPPQRIRPCDLQELIKSSKLRKVCGIDDIPN
jgi:hypothetical protein